LIFLGAQLALAAAIDLFGPGLYDAEYAVRLDLLRRRRAEAPERPLLLVLGSSRMVMSFRPESLPELRDADGRRVLPFNFAHLGAGPVMNVMQLNRLRRAGVRPTWLVLEVMPPCLSNDPASMTTSCMSAPDLPVLHHYIDPGKLYGRYLLTRLAPWHRQRNELLHRFAPAFAAREWPAETARIHLGPLGGDACWTVKPDVSADEIRRRIDATRRDYYPPLQQFALKGTADRAYREMLDLCRADGIRVALLLSPEGSEFASWYSPQSLTQIQEWCLALSREYDAPLIDARRWLPDAAFLDGHHVQLHGAEAFTRRLGEEALRPLVEGRLSASALPSGILPHPCTR
jgi:hypothetical protein